MQRRCQRQALVLDAWPGRVRRPIALQHVVFQDARAITSNVSGIAVTDLPETIRKESTTAADFVIPPRRALAEIEKMAILQTLQQEEEAVARPLFSSSCMALVRHEPPFHTERFVAHNL